MMQKFNFTILFFSIFFSLTNIPKVFSQDSLAEYKELFRHWIQYSGDANKTYNKDTLEFIPHNSAIVDNLPLHIKYSGTTYQENHIVTYQHWRKCGNETPSDETSKTIWTIAKVDDKTILTIVSENRKQEYYITFLNADKLILINKK
jgi:hypothetical protein